jgi:DNA-binding transcriptional ArsR family regulator
MVKKNFMRNLSSRSPVLFIDDLDTVKILTDPLRLQIIDILSPKPMTVNQVASRLGLPNSRLYYHFNLLEQHGLIEVVETRVVNNLIEKLYWLVADEIKIDKTLLDFSTGETRKDVVSMVSSLLEATHSEMMRSLQARKAIPEHGVQPVPPDMVINSSRKRLSDESYQKFVEKLRSLIKEFSELPEETDLGDDANEYSLACFLYPNIYKNNNEAERE